MVYTEKEVFRLAKRYRNVKRQYLIVDPLQGKHIPSRPTETLCMLDTLGKTLRQKYNDVGLVIGFAETATAIGAAVSLHFPDDCVYISTTREEMSGSHQFIHFTEDHSHAVDQSLCSNHLEEWIKHTDQIIIVDDELSTGKTLLNCVLQLRDYSRLFQEKEIIAASIINRMSEDNINALQQKGVKCEYLVRLPQEDYSESVKDWKIEAPLDVTEVLAHNVEVHAVNVMEELPDIRKGVSNEVLRNGCNAIASSLLSKEINQHLHEKMRILVLGTEEFMYPALVLAQKIEVQNPDVVVRFHATTRSPIGISNKQDYPIFNGFCLNSFYNKNRITYLYDLESCDMAVVFSDAPVYNEAALNELAGILERFGCKTLLFVNGGRNA